MIKIIAKDSKQREYSNKNPKAISGRGVTLNAEVACEVSPCNEGGTSDVLDALHQTTTSFIKML